jgi:hypothetical protein
VRGEARAKMPILKPRLGSSNHCLHAIGGGGEVPETKQHPVLSTRAFPAHIYNPDVTLRVMDFGVDLTLSLTRPGIDPVDTPFNLT